MTNKERLKRIAEIIEAVDNRCMAVDGPVTPTLQEMTQKEILEIYNLASHKADSADKKKLGKKYVCRLCEPTPEDPVGEHRELCKMSYCKQCKKKTWHYPTFAISCR